jgi:hypothetical protein
MSPSPGGQYQHQPGGSSRDDPHSHTRHNRTSHDAGRTPDPNRSYANPTKPAAHAADHFTSGGAFNPG